MRFLTAIIVALYLSACSILNPGYLSERPDITAFDPGTTTFGEATGRLGDPATSQFSPGRSIRGTWYYKTEGASTDIGKMIQGNYRAGCNGCGELRLGFNWNQDFNNSVLQTISLRSPALDRDFEQAMARLENGQVEHAATIMQRLASSHYTRAEHILGLMHLNGDGVEQNAQAARQLFERGAAKGHARAQYDLGVMYRNGESVPVDRKRAALLYQRAAEQGHAQAAWELGKLFEEQGNQAMAEKYYDQAREAGYEPQ